MPDKDEIALEIAKHLLQINAIKLSVQKPFQWASGWNSPIYCDNRQLLSYPDIRSYVIDAFVDRIKSDYPEANAIAGVATAGIAHAALIGDRMNLPMIYVRSKPKGHGLGQSIEGAILPDMKVVVIEDLISTGGSSLKAVEDLRAADIEVLGLGAIFSYAFDQAEKNIKQAKCSYFTLSNYHALIQLVKEDQLVEDNDLQSLQDWRLNPAEWSNN